jgi:hypothetical protein
MQKFESVEDEKDEELQAPSCLDDLWDPFPLIAGWCAC